MAHQIDQHGPTRSAPPAHALTPHASQPMLALGLLMTGLAALLVGCGGGSAAAGGGAPPDGAAQGGPPPQMVRIAEARLERQQDRWDVIGRLEAIHRATIAAEREGTILRMGPVGEDGQTPPPEIEEGQEVEADRTVIATLDPTFINLTIRELEAEKIEAEAAVSEARASIAQSQAAVAEARANRDKAENDLRYLEDLLSEQSAKPKEVEDARAVADANRAAFEAANASVDAARARLESAQARVRTIEARLATAQEELDRTVIRAPFDGVVTRTIGEKGQWAGPGYELAEIISRGRIDAVLFVPEQLINIIEEGQTLEVTVDPLGVSVPGTVIAKIPSGSNAARTFPIKVRLPDQVDVEIDATQQTQRKRLMPGMSVTAQTPTADPVQVITVPRSALLRGAQGPHVWLNVEGQAVKVDVQVLFGLPDRFAVRPMGDESPLTDGAMVVIEGAERIFMPGQPLLPVDEQGVPLEARQPDEDQPQQPANS